MSNLLNLTVLNCGKNDLTIDAVYVDGTAVSTYLGGKGVNIGISDVILVRFVSPFPIVIGQTYKIIVANERGNNNEVSWQA